MLFIREWISDIGFLWKFLLMIVIASFIFSKVRSKFFATTLVCFFFWIILTNSILAVVMAILYLLFSFGMQGFKAMEIMMSVDRLNKYSKQYGEQESQIRNMEQMSDQDLVHMYYR